MTIAVLLTGALLSFVLVVLIRAESCSTGFSRVGNKCYYVSLEAANWHVADRKCRKLGADLMVFEDAQDQELTIAHLKSHGLTFTDVWHQSVWVGINCLGARRNFTLSKTGDPVPFLNWVPREPDNATPEEDCVAFANYRRAFGYHDIECNYEFSYVCETPVSNNYLCAKQELFTAATL
ncbi:C-type lectin 37Db-like [Drosophila subobscura]|uniref:C-type lectin 37Db-like n=1 Tax=Drosophila subobscura TaxID=7241 RepID=UPI00155A577D|nr:C-type lectin 37Db-like [Drosophila subobscura]